MSINETNHTANGDENRGSLPNFILAGVPKSGTTWIYEAFADHPDIDTHPPDTLQYFDINHHRGIGWYENAFSATGDGHVIGEASPSYLYTEGTPSRIAKTIPDVQLVFCLRNPIDRAFSQWWHGYSSGYWGYEFESALVEIPPYQFLVEPGLYTTHLKRFEQYFNREDIHIMLFDDLVADNSEFIRHFFDIVDVDPGYKPEILGDKSNVARFDAPSVYRRAVRWMRRNSPDRVNAMLRPVWEPLRKFIEDRSPYEAGMSPETREDLERLYEPEIRGLSDRLDRDLSHWFDMI